MVDKDELKQRLIRYSPHVTACVNAMNTGDLESAKRHLTEFYDSPLPRHKAIAARLLLQVGDAQEARRLLGEAIVIAQKNKNDVNRYITSYCSAFLIASKSRAGFALHAKAALAAAPSNELFNCLPIYDPDKHPDLNNAFS